MRTYLPILLLLLCAGGLLVLVLDPGAEDGPAVELETTPEPGPSPVPVNDPPAQVEPDVIGVVPDGAWDTKLDELEPEPLLRHPLVRKAPEINVSGDREWRPTGTKVLEILTKALAGKARVRFHDQEALDDFRKRTWPQDLPGRVPLLVILESCHEVGFRPVARSDGFYLIRIDKP